MLTVFKDNTDYTFGVYICKKDNNITKQNEPET
jgi:hypothetical protein